MHDEQRRAADPAGRRILVIAEPEPVLPTLNAS
jgi:hypothetical protein